MVQLCQSYRPNYATLNPSTESLLLKLHKNAFSNGSPLTRVIAIKGWPEVKGNFDREITKINALLADTQADTALDSWTLL